MSVSEIQLFQILKLKLGEREAEDLVQFVKSEVKSEIENKKDGFASKDDILKLEEKISGVKSDVLRSVYIVGLVQFLAIVSSVLMIVNFMLK